MSRRSPPDSRRTLAARLPSIDPETVAATAVAVGVVLAIGTVLFGGFAPDSRPFVSLLYPLALLFPALGAVLVLGVCWWLWDDDGSSAPPLLEGNPPETMETCADEWLGRETERELTNAARGWYACSMTGSAADVRRRLVEGAVRTLTTKYGLATAAAREAVRSGSWTDDPVAAAFLADDLRQPPRERRRAAIDPGAAYDRRVRRTLDAIEALDGQVTDPEVAQ
ncbi:hypothetical protein [Natrinema sp. 74]|uniref:DUF7269 family protein n=1 Tax=Natrinema sp. 74 TaxID=3384159 RepID=UPI0038D3BBC4